MDFWKDNLVGKILYISDFAQLIYPGYYVVIAQDDKFVYFDRNIKPLALNWKSQISRNYLEHCMKMRRIKVVE